MECEKARMAEWEALGICEGNDGNICPECIGDPALAEFISNNATQGSCKYCGQERDRPFASRLSVVAEHMATIVNEEFQHVARGTEGLYHDGFENLLLLEIEFKPTNDCVRTDIASFFNKRIWGWKDTFSDRLQCAWNRFCDKVRHSRRYTFWWSTEDIVPEGHPLHLPASKVLDEVSIVVAELGLIRELPIGTEFWRAQPHKNGKSPKPPEEFTSAPVNLAVTPNRMSPAGIPMFYGADDFETAVCEITPKDAPLGWRASAVRFKALRPLQVLDLSVDLAPKLRQRSYFALDGRRWRHYLRFLEQFSGDVSQRFIYDHEFLQRCAGEPRPEIDYAPTQVFTEYVRYHLHSPGGQPIDGIRYRSSLSDSGCCVVLFFDQDDCLKSRRGHQQSLGWIPGSRKEAVIEHVNLKWRYEDFSEG